MFNVCQTPYVNPSKCSQYVTIRCHRKSLNILHSQDKEDYYHTGVNFYLLGNNTSEIVTMLSE